MTGVRLPAVLSALEPAERLDSSAEQHACGQAAGMLGARCCTKKSTDLLQKCFLCWR